MPLVIGLTGGIGSGKSAAAAEFAQDSPEPDPAELWTDVYAEAE